MRILALNLSHHASAVIVEDGKISLAIENERISTIKHDSSIKETLTILKNENFDCIGYTSYDINLNKKNYYENLIKKDLVTFNIKYKELIEFPFHHETHAFSSFYNSGFDKAICLIVDNGGLSYQKDTQQLGQEILSIIKIDGTECSPILKICSNKDNNSFIDEKIKSYPTISPAGIFELTKSIYSYKEPGAVMGRSSYGKKNSRICDLFKFKDNCFYVNPFFLTQIIYSIHEIKINENDMCYKIQKDCTDIILKYLELINKDFPSYNICLSGGFFQNCMANYEIIKNKYDVFVDPVSNDGGTAIGLAQYIYQLKTNKKPEVYNNLYLGLHNDEITKEKINLIDENIVCKQTNPNEVANLLKQNKSVALFQGRSEFGPRALGNRSLLYNPNDFNAKEKINLIKKREWFRPYAGTVLYEDKDEWFNFYGKDETKYMSYAVKIKEPKCNIIPGVCHIDKTCRVQTLKKEDNFDFYELIEEFKKLTGIPILLNTSLNVAGKPLVETIEHALDFLNKTDTDYLYLPETYLLLSKRET